MPCKTVKGRYYPGVGGEKVLVRNLSKKEMTKFMQGPIFNPKSQIKLKKEGRIW